MKDLWKKTGANSAKFQQAVLLHTQAWFQFEKQMKRLKTRFASSRDR
jgi:hypothetical protein